MPDKLTILIPVFNDAESLNRLLLELDQTFKDRSVIDCRLLLVNDGSTDQIQIRKPASLSAEIIHLVRNVGHQKAIAIGLAYIKENLDTDRVLIMDADGEDRPEDALTLVNESIKEPGKIIFAKRTSRQEGSRFKFFYSIYKLAFRILTGKKIAYGNFLVMPKNLLEKTVYYSEIWNHIAGGILKTGLPFKEVPSHRGKRYAGESKMNFHSLLVHGLGAIAVFIETIASRLLVFSLTLIGISLAAILVLIGIKTFTDKAIPGWTSTVISAMLVILLQSFLLSLFTIFLFLSSQSQRKFIPAHHYKDYTGKVETIH